MYCTGMSNAASQLPYRYRGLARPRRDPGEHVLTIRIPADVERALRERATLDRTSMASIIIAALDAAGVTEPSKKRSAR